jgi:hypothetical protein
VKGVVILALDPDQPYPDRMTNESVILNASPRRGPKVRLLEIARAPREAILTKKIQLLGAKIENRAAREPSCAAPVVLDEKLRNARPRFERFRLRVDTETADLSK